MSLDSIFTTIFVSDLTIEEFLVCLLSALLLGMLIAFLYTFQAKYSKGFIVTLVIIPSIVAMIIMMVNDSIGAGIAVAGAFSLIRFRSVPGTAKEIGSIFLAVATGLAIGMGQVAFAFIFTVLVGGANLALSKIKFGTPKDDRRVLHLNMPSDLDYETILSDILSQYASSFNLISLETCKDGSLFKLAYELNLNEDVDLKTFIDEIRARNHNNNVSITRGSSRFNQL